MSRHLMLVTSAPAAGRDDDYHAFYDGQHVPDILRTVPGLRSCRRFGPSAQQSAVIAAGKPAPYVAIYEIEADDIGEVVMQLDAAAVSGTWRPAPEGAFSPERSLTFYTLLSEHSP
jgi:hypothetical protein